MGIASVLISHVEPDWVKRLRFGGAPVTVAPLDAGDVVVLLDDGTILGIERKAASDFLNTLRDDRLFPQMARLRELTPWAYLCINGDLQCGLQGLTLADGRQTAWNWASTQGALLSVQEAGIHVVHCGVADFEATVLRIAARDRSTIRVAPARDLELLSEAEQILTSLPGIGPEKAAALLSYAGTAADALAYLTSIGFDGPKAPGIGNGIKSRVRKALGLPDWGALEVLAPATKESTNVA